MKERAELGKTDLPLRKMWVAAHFRASCGTLSACYAKSQRSTNSFLMHLIMLPSEGDYLRFHRKISGLSLRELADVIGLAKEERISLHEQSREVPLLITAFGYEIAFHVPASQLFPRLYGSVHSEVESRLTALRERLERSAAKGHSATMVARKLRWLRARGDEGHGSSPFAK